MITPALPVTSQSPYCNAYRDHEARSVLVAALSVLPGPGSDSLVFTLVKLRMMCAQHATHTLPPSAHRDLMCVSLSWAGFEGGAVGRSSEFLGGSLGLSDL